MNSKAAFSRINIFLSLALVSFTFTACTGQSNLMSLATAQPVPATAPVALQTLCGSREPSVAGRGDNPFDRTRAGAQQFPFMDDPTFREFFGDRLRVSSSNRNAGAGRWFGSHHQS